MALIIFLLNFLLLSNFCETARILAVMPTPSFSHQVVFQPLWKKLLLKGHEVTLLTTDPIKDANFINLKQIDWSFAYDLWHKKHNLSRIIMNFRENKLQCFNQYVNMMHDIVTQELEHEDVQKLIVDENERFDLAIIEFLHPTMLAFSERFNCPYIGVTSMDSTTFGHDMVGNPTNPAVYTDFLVPYDSKMSFFERFMNTLNYIGVTLYFNLYMYPREDRTARKFFREDLPKLRDIQKKASMVFVNTHPVLHDARPLMPNVLQVGGGMHLSKLNALPQDLEMFLNSSQNGVIYFSLGSNVKVLDLPEQTFNVLLETFAQLPFGIVWKVENNDLVKSVGNIFVGQWLPQQEILAHKNVKLFITQGGQQSLEEAIYYGVPIIGIPFYVDQFANIRRLARRGACIGLDAQNLKKADLEKAIYEVTKNESYLQSVRELSSLLKEAPMPSLEKAVWWTEFVIRHKGAKLLKSDVPHMPYYQYLLLDVIATLTCIAALCLFLEYKLFRFLIKYYRHKVNKHRHTKLE